MAAREKIPSKKKYCCREFFAPMRSFKDTDNVLEIRADEALAALFQPNTLAPAD